MIPLPYRFQCLLVEVVTSVIRCSRLGGRIIGFKPCARCTPQILFQSEVRPSVNPCDRRKGCGTPHSIEILHGYAPPFSIFGLHDTALMNSGTREHVVWSFVLSKLETLFGYGSSQTGIACSQGCRIPERLTSTDHTGLIRSVDIFGTGALHASHWRVVCRNDIIHPVDFIYMMSFTHRITFGYNHLFRTLDRSAEVGFQLGAGNVSVFVYGIDLTIVIEEDGEVVDITIYAFVCPRTFDVVCDIHMQSMTVDIREYIIFTVMVTDAGSPYSLTVHTLSVLEIKFGEIEVEPVETVGT